MSMPRLTVFALILAAIPAVALANPLPADQEGQLKQRVEQRQTADGSTVLEALRGAEAVYPDEFKLQKFKLAYDSNHRPTAVAICYWIGSNRTDDDAGCDIQYDIEPYYFGLAPDKASIGGPDKLAQALEQGKTAFSGAVDDEYRLSCFDAMTYRKLC
jgi:hypothetical protein